LAISFKSEAALKETQSVENVSPSKRKKGRTRRLVSAQDDGSQSRGVAGVESCLPNFINTTNHGLKVKMPDSVHIFLPGETIEFLPKELGEDGADRELARRARRAEMKSKASMDWAKRNKGN
jgi:hypothetical protein